MKLERGTTERVLMVKPSGEVSRTERIFSWLSLTLRNWKILWNQKYLLELLQLFQHWVRGCEWAGERINVYWLIKHLLHLWHWRYDEVHTGSELLYVCEIGWMTCRKGVWKFVTLTGVSVRWCDMHSFSVYWRSWTVGRYLHQTWTVLIFLYGGRGYRAWFLDAILGFSGSTLSMSLSGYQFKTLFSDMIVGECVQKHSRCIWSSHYVSELVYDVFWTSVSILDFATYILDVRKPLTLFWVCGILRHCEDNAYVYYLTSGYLIWKSV